MNEKLTKEEELHKYNSTPYERIEVGYSEHGEPFRRKDLKLTKEEITSIEAIPIGIYLAFLFVVLLCSCWLLFLMLF